MSIFAGKGKEDFKDGIGVKAGFKSLYDIAIDQRTGNLFVSDQHCIRKISPKGSKKIKGGRGGRGGRSIKEKGNKRKKENNKKGKEYKKEEEN